jgi:predicted amidophosphoribosyltransferase
VKVVVMRELWRGLQQEIASLVLPVGCAGCGLLGVRGQLCRQCAERLSGAVPRRVWPQPVPRGLPPVYAALPYADEARAVLLAHKERGALPLSAPLGAVLAAAVRSARRRRRMPAVGGPVILVPVPSSRRAVAARGHDPVRRLALAAARRLRRDGLPARALAVLRQRRVVADQSGLTARQRLANLSGALEIVPGSERMLDQGEVVLVDDLMTTGASLAEAARAVERGVCGAIGAVRAAVVAARSGG